MRSILVLTVASTLCAVSAGAQSMSGSRVFGVYQQAHWQERDGLPQNTVLAITKTRDGYLWVGTYEGAARFDGVRFTVFTASNTAGLGNSMINGLLEKRDGHLWLATYGGGISRVTGGRFTQYAQTASLASDFTNCLFEDRAGTLWIATDGGGLSALRQDGRVSTYTAADGLPGNVVRAVAEDGRGSLVVGTDRGIATITAGQVSRYAGPSEITDANISRLAVLADGSLWVAPQNGGLYRTDSTGMTRFGAGHGLTSDTVLALLADADGVVWVGTVGGGLFRYSAGRFERYAHADGLPGGRVTAIAQDVDRGLWVGTDLGLVRLTRPLFTVYTQRDGLAADQVGHMFHDAADSMWLVAGGRLTRFIDRTFKVFSTRDGLPDNRIRGIAASADGLAFVYSGSSLFRWHDDRFVAVEDVSGLPWNRATSVLRDRSGTLWLGINEGGLIRVRAGDRTLLTREDGLADDSVLKLFEDRAGNIWVGTLRNGVTRISHEEMTSWSVADGLAANHVKAFYEDSTGALWIGTHGGGLSRFKDGKFSTISTRQGLYKDDIFQILEDDDGNLWMNCNSGISRTSLTQLHEVADGKRPAVESFGYATADGMLSSEGTGSSLAGARMRNGSLWFPTTKGAVVIHPRRRETEPPRVVIEGATIDRRPVAIGDVVQLSPGQRNLEIQYTALSWDRPQAVRFRVQMSGIDRDWVEAGARRTAYYSYLPPGSYTFRVTADNGEGVWSEVGQTLAVVVLPRFYQTWWFQPVAVSIVIGVLWLSWRHRMAQIRRAQAVQQAFSRELIESQERERQRIAAELHDSLGQSLLVIKNRALLGARSQPDAQALTQFNEIGATVAHTLDEVRTISYNLRPHHLDQLGLTTAIGAMIEKMAGSSKIAMRSELDDIDGVFAPADEITIYRIIQEGLNNLVKHAHASEAQVTVRRREHHVEIAIRDNGQGFSSRPDAPVHPSGFGLKGIAHRVDMLGGTHTIDSRPGRGTTVSVRIPV